MKIEIKDDQAEALKAALKLAIPKVSRDPHGDALQELLDLLGGDSDPTLSLSKRKTGTFFTASEIGAVVARSEADEILGLIKRK